MRPRGRHRLQEVRSIEALHPGKLPVRCIPPTNAEDIVQQRGCGYPVFFLGYAKGPNLLANAFEPRTLVTLKLRFSRTRRLSFPAARPKPRRRTGSSRCASAITRRRVCWIFLPVTNLSNNRNTRRQIVPFGSGETFEPPHEILVRLLWGGRGPSGTIPSTAQRTARLLVLGFELADHSLGLVVEGDDDLVGVLFRVVKSQAADREIDDFMTVPRSRPGW